MTIDRLARETDDDTTKIVLAALDAAEHALRATRALLQRQAPAAQPEWLTLAAVQARLGTPSPRATQDALGVLEVEIARVGRARLVRASDLDAALAARVRPRAPVQAPPADAGDRALAAAGLRVVGGRASR